MKIMLIANKDVSLYLFRKEFVDELVNNENDVIIVCPYGKNLEYFKNIGCQLVNYKLNRRSINPINDFILLIKYYKILRKYKPDYVFTFTIKPNIYIGIIRRFINIKFFPTITGLGTSISSEGLLYKFMIILYKISFKKAEVVVFQNKTNLEWFNKNIKLNILSKLVNGSGVNLEKYSYKPYTATSTKILFLGRIMKEKGIEELIDASMKVKKIYGNEIEILIAGFFEENYESKINEMVQEGIIRYLGYIDNTIDLISECSAVVLPSYHEGLSNVLLEAQSIGRAVIASRIPGCVETFIDGISGISVNVKDSHDLFNKIVFFHLLKREDKIKMGLAGRNFVEKHYDRNKVVQDYIKLIK